MRVLLFLAAAALGQGPADGIPSGEFRLDQTGQREGAPRQIQMYDRRGNPQFTIGGEGDRTRFGIGVTAFINMPEAVAGARDNVTCILVKVDNTADDVNGKDKTIPLYLKI